MVSRSSLTSDLPCTDNPLTYECIGPRWPMFPVSGGAGASCIRDSRRYVSQPASIQPASGACCRAVFARLTTVTDCAPQQTSDGYSTLNGPERTTPSQAGKAESNSGL